MKIEKCLCDICGNEIADSHPLRMELQEYTKGYRPCYKKVKTYEICDECQGKLPDLFKALKGVK